MKQEDSRSFILNAIFGFFEWGTAGGILILLFELVIVIIANLRGFSFKYSLIPLLPGVAAGYSVVGVFCVKLLSKRINGKIKAVYSLFGAILAMSTAIIVWDLSSNNFDNPIAASFAFTGFPALLAILYTQFDEHEWRRLTIRDVMNFIVRHMFN
jgi:hypothetical protein